MSMLALCMLFFGCYNYKILISVNEYNASFAIDIYIG